jgi:chaperonin cofactor prefoldin
LAFCHSCYSLIVAMNPDEPQTPEPINLSRPDGAESPSGSVTPNPQPIREPLNLSPVGSSVGSSARTEADDLARRVAELQQQEKALRQEISSLQSSYNAMLQKQIAEAQMALGRVVKESVTELEQRRQTLQLAVEQLERRQERIKNEMRTTFAGASQDLAVRVQGFKDYLVGSLQDLATAAEQLQLTPAPEEIRRPAVLKPEAIRDVREVRDARDTRDTREIREIREPRDARPAREVVRTEAPEPEAITPKFTESSFQEQAKRIRQLLDQYRSSPDYYGPPWQLRRTFEPVHAERVSNWFFTQGGRGAIRTMGSRLQNILIASAVISVLNELYGERLRPLILGNSPERLGEWRRGLQDCLGVSRADFGIDEGIVLFEAPEPLAQRAERLVKQKQLPLIILDETEEFISVSLLQFPLWLAFAPDPNAPNPMMY